MFFLLALCRLSKAASLGDMIQFLGLYSLHAFNNDKISDGYTLFTDLTGLDAGGGRVFPPDVIVTSQRLDMVVINSELRRVIIFELTFPLDINVGTAHDYKMGKYASLVNNSQGDGYIVVD